jgi:predicted transcriptional regulator of viral defense system
MRREPSPFRNADVVELLGKTSNAAAQWISAQEYYGRITRVKRGLYTIAEVTQ